MNIDRSARAGSERERRTRELVDELHTCVAAGPEGMERQTRLRQELVLANVAVATSIALRYRGRGEPFEDVAQSAYLGLVKAANGFDVDTVQTSWPMRHPRSPAR